MAELTTANIAMESTCILVMISLIVGIISSGLKKNKLSQILICMLVLGCLYLGSDVLSWIYNGSDGHTARVIVSVSNYLIYILGYPQLALLYYYILTYIKLRDPNFSSKFAKASLIFCIVIVVISVIVLLIFTDYVYYINESNQFTIGPLYQLTLYCSLIFYILNTLLIIRNRKKLELKSTLILLFILFFLFFTAAIEILFPSFMYVSIGYTVAMIILYVSIQVQQELEAVRHETNIQTAVMLSQIQPHFMFNSLGAINELCVGNPDAQKAIVTFSEYLRGNMDSLSNNQLIPFEQELDHVKQYLYLEDLRFGDRLEVVYDIETSDFMLPPLTLQPIVENGVRHGISKKIGGGRLSIVTHADEDNYYIEVEDNGVGFDIDKIKKNSNNHIGISNVKVRLKNMCDGSINIKSETGVGTKVIMTIPIGGKHS